MFCFTAPPETRRISRLERGSKVDVDREFPSKAEVFREDEIPALDVPGANSIAVEGDKTPSDGAEREANDEKTEGDKADDADKKKEQTNKEKKIWMDYGDFCKCFRLEGLRLLWKYN